jgi:hypothetical protein
MVTPMGHSGGHPEDYLRESRRGFEAVDMGFSR